MTKWADIPKTTKDFLAENTLKCYKTRETSHMPEYSSANAACFDLKASIQPGDVISYYSPRNVSKKSRLVKSHVPLVLYSGDRMLIPTGIIFDLEEHQSLRIHSRSGLVLKQGIAVANSEGIVDADYVEETFVLLTNMTDGRFDITDGMRIAQAEIVINKQVHFSVTDIRPEPKTDRNGGFGSTGV